MATQTYVNSVTLTDAAEFNKFDTAAYAALSGVAGTNTITATGPANLTLVATNPIIWLIPAATNTGATTLNITPSGGAALGAKNVFARGAACVGGEIVIGVPVAVVYDGTQYNIISAAPPTLTGTSASTFTWDGSGGTSGSVTMTYQKIGNFVTLNIPALSATTGTSSTTLTSNTALPAAIRPAATQDIAVNSVLESGGGISSPGVLQVASSGVINIRKNNATGTFNNTASCGTSQNTTFTYFIG